MEVIRKRSGKTSCNLIKNPIKIAIQTKSQPRSTNSNLCCWQTAQAKIIAEKRI